MEFTNFSHFMDSLNLGNFPAYGLKLWLDASDLSTITKDGSNLISQIDDKSGNGYHATQGTGANQPTWVDNQQNGKAIARFDGSADHLILPSGLYDIPTGPNTIFAVAKQDADGAAERVLTMAVNNSTRYCLLFEDTANSLGFVNNTSFDRITIGGATTTNFNAVYGRRSGTTQAIAFNGGSENTETTAVNGPGINQAIIGATGNGLAAFLNGDIGEILVYDRSLSEAEITLVIAYLLYKWGLL